MPRDKMELLGAERLRALLEEQREPLFARAGEGRDPSEIGLALGRAHARVLDELFVTIFPAAPAAREPDLALAAVGGYGRGAVALGADVDLRILTRDLERAERFCQALLYPLWDAGVAVGHQVVTVDDLLAAAREDLPTATSLLDWRYIAGDRALSEELQRAAAQGIFALSALPQFLERLEQEVNERHARFGGSVYMLEPDVKNGRGALRDLDVAWWAARARWNVDEFSDLLKIGVLVPRQLAAVERARELLWRIRNLLHAQVGRRSDRLSFEMQEAIAAPLGYRESPPLAVEQMMSDYYRAARTVSRFRELAMARATPVFQRRRPSYEDLGGGLMLLDGQAGIVKPELVQSDPPIALRVVKAAVDRGVPLKASTRGALIDACGDDAWTTRLRESQEAAALFVELVISCSETVLRRGSVMRELHDLGLLLAMVPEFGPVVGRVHHDTYHVYTVDVHSVAAVDRLGEIVRGDIEVDTTTPHGHAWVGSLACRLAAEVTSRRVLFFATLLHDVGKAIGRRDHSERGAEMARTILARLRFSDEEIEAVTRLILHHLTMYHVATRRDLDDPATAEELAQVVRDSEGLRDLYLLTVADLSTTSPTSMTSWKARMLDELYVATEQFWRGSPAEIEPRIAEARALAKS
ncbi:MAG TPA: HD domain-containing protein, partial [Polyangiaceae bacterium]|nr:HD domain-containing protein [Polyangiaceae bacterium]